MTEKSVLKLFNELIESLSDAEGCCSQLIHLAGHPTQFMMVREALALTKEGCIKVAPHNALVAPKTVYVNKKR